MAKFAYGPGGAFGTNAANATPSTRSQSIPLRSAASKRNARSTLDQKIETVPVDTLKPARQAIMQLAIADRP